MYKLKLYYKDKIIVGLTLWLNDEVILDNKVNTLNNNITSTKLYEYDTVKKVRGALYELFEIKYLLPRNVISYFDLEVTKRE